MKANYLWLKRMTKLGMTLMVGVSLGACAATTWKEEVLLHDGSKLIMERTTNRHGRHEIGQRPPIGDQSISFSIPGNNRQVVWKDEFSEDVSGANFNLMALDVVQGVAYLVVTPAGCLSYNKWGRPNPPYVIFKYEGNAWERISLQELPAEITAPNILHSSPDEVAEKTKKGGIVSAEVIKSENKGFRQPEFRSILREGLTDYWKSCPKMVSYGKQGGWIGLDWFTDQPSLDACLKFCDRKKVSAETCPCNEVFKGK